MRCTWTIWILLTAFYFTVWWKLFILFVHEKYDMERKEHRIVFIRMIRHKKIARMKHETRTYAHANTNTKPNDIDELRMRSRARATSHLKIGIELCMTYGYPNKRDRKNDVLGSSSHLCHLFAILNLPPIGYTVLFDHRTQPSDKNT